MCLQFSRSSAPQAIVLSNPNSLLIHALSDHANASTSKQEGYESVNTEKMPDGDRPGQHGQASKDDKEPIPKSHTYSS
jgi:hypothetical protein